MPSHQEAVEAIKKALLSTGKEVLIKALVKKVPFLFFGPWGAVTELLIGKLVEILINETEFATFALYIDLRTDRQGKVFSEAVRKNYHAQLNGTEDEKIKSEKELIEKFKEFAMLTS